MAMGQGATMALPIWAYFMKKVYKDVSLGYSKDASFGVPEDFNPCQKEIEDDGDADIDDVFE